MKRADLEATVASYLHRQDLGAEIVGFVDLAISRINRDLRVRAMHKVDETFTKTGRFTPLPADYVGIYDVAGSVNGIVRSLESAQPRIANVHQQSFQARVYRIAGKTIEFPGAPEQGVFTLEYYASVAFDAQGDSPACDDFPTIFLNAAMVEAHTYTLAADARAIAVDVYLAEVAEANAVEAGELAGAAPAVGVT